jgi:hypothetical protein
MTTKKPTTKPTTTKTPLTQDELKQAFHDTWRDLRAAITTELVKMNAGETAITSSNVSAITKFLELTQSTAIDTRNSIIDPVPYDGGGITLPVFNDDDDDEWQKLPSSSKR